jgi:hypothetical protein
MIISVSQPFFYINRNNPQEVKYQPQDAPENEIAQWRAMIVESYQYGCRPPQEGEILYQYSANRGCYLKIEADGGFVDIQRPPFFIKPDTPAQRSSPDIKTPNFRG